MRSARPTVVLLTESRYERPAPAAARDPYVANILLEDEIVADALARVGFAVERVDWRRFDPSGGYVAAVFRTTWDYFDRWPEFAAFLDRTLGALPIFNPPALVRWNVDKHYLLELARAGVSVPRTIVVERGEAADLSAVMAELGADEVVVKPCIGGAARQTRRISRGPAAFSEHAAWFRDMVAAEAMMVQPFVPEVLEAGEVSVLIFDGMVTHAVRKRAKPGDFRVQDDHGGTVGPCEVDADRASFASRALAAAEAACGERALYARVDFVETPRGPQLMELELVEPELFVRTAPQSADVLARGLARRLAEGR